MNPDRDKRTPFVPKHGEVYKNHGGGTFRCLDLEPTCETSWFQNIYSGWTFMAHGLRKYPDGTIEWDYSTGGFFDTKDAGGDFDDGRR